jgi:ATP-dependent Clp protease ATP-binding subunit ClpA
VTGNLRTNFPAVFERLLRERAEGRIAEEARGRVDPYQEILTQLRTRVRGQDLATHELAATMASQANQDANQVFLFIGPTGVGKTELAKAVASAKSGFVSFNMSEYTSEHDISKFFGSPTGYIGSDDLPHFAKEIAKHETRVGGDREVRNIVILFDEFEKTAEEIKQSLLRIFDEGLYAANYTANARGFDAKNETSRYVFKKCVFICTSNLFHDYLLDVFRRRIENVDEIRTGFVDLNRMAPPFSHRFSPELLGRMRIIPFGPIPRGACYQRLLKDKLDQFIPNFKRELSCKDIVVENEPLVLQDLEHKLYGDGTDIRRVARYLTEAKAIVYREKSRWGDLNTKRLTIVFEAHHGLQIKVSYFDPVFNCYSGDLFLINLP